LFKEFEARPPACSAVLVSFDTVEDIARYYGESGYQTTLTRQSDGIRLVIQREASDELPAVQLMVVLDDVRERQVLVHGRPPYLVSEADFVRTWRPVEPSK
jgi:hypothetical protein